MNNIRSASYPGGGTDIAAGLDFVTNHVFNTSDDRPSVLNVLVLITDGQSNYDQTVQAAQRAKAYMTIFTIGIGTNIDMNLLRAVSSPPQLPEQNYFTSANFSGLSIILEQVTTETCIIEHGKSMHEFFCLKIRLADCKSNECLMNSPFCFNDWSSIFGFHCYQFE